jgi:hypothetical protein
MYEREFLQPFKKNFGIWGLSSDEADQLGGQEDHTWVMKFVTEEVRGHWVNGTWASIWGLEVSSTVVSIAFSETNAIYTAIQGNIRGRIYATLRAHESLNPTT